MKKNKRVLIYSRVSTAHHDQDPDVQRRPLREFCEARGWKIVEDVVDHGYSGGTDKRPGLVKLMSLARSRSIDACVVVKMCRLFRSLKHLITTLEEFQSLGVEFISLGDSIDMSTPSGRLSAQILGAVSEFDRALVRERTLAGLAHARSKGKRLGRPQTAPYAEIVKLRASGMSYSKIQSKLGVSRPAIGRAIKATGTKSPQKSL